ncbi:neutral zinc metallopeptidase [Nocardioides yefusunii]|uniref:Neutral zinc metallopeptidase n=1 Tax=Nocardioides yefusunii TaxID=2500546 RepID=A0ABW1QXE4_9ACTN|nr:neutral zinc metallopeptidase [Nocardioides yefusunii]
MRFNPKANLDTSRTSDRGRSGGGGLGGGLGGGSVPLPGSLKAGGGAGVVIVLLVVLATSCLGGGGGTGGVGGAGLDQIFGQSAGTDVSRMAGEDSARYASCKTGEDANSSVDCARVAVENSLYAFWDDEFTAQGKKFRPAVVNTFSGNVSTACGAASSSMGPFYCPADQQIFLDTTFFSDVLEGQLGGQGGDFVEPYVLGHEYGHHIQNLLGTMNKVRTQQGADSDAVRLELQADCYAGMWARSAAGLAGDDGVAIIEELDRSDISEALDSAKAVGDDRIQQRSGGKVNSDGWTHGSSQQRMNWFMTGYETGSLKSCDTFAARTL